MKLNEAEVRARHSEEVENLTAQLKAKDADLSAYRREHGVLETFFRAIRSAIEPIKPTPSEYKPRKGRTKIATPCAAVAHITDGHMGAVQAASEIEGFCAYSPEIARARQLGFIRSFCEWAELHRHAYTIDDAYVLVTGDLISGDIHEDLRVTNAFPSPVQAVRAGMLLAEQIAIMAPNFQRVFVRFISEDNHARLTKRPQAKEAGLNTLNYVVGEIAKAYLRDLGAVDFVLSPMYETVVNVHGRQYLISHGHGVQGWAGVPWYGIERKVGKESVARMQVIMQDIGRAKSIGFHKYVFGHWHTPFNMPLYACGGSPMGTDALDHKEGRFARPSQKAWMVHPQHGEFDWIDFQLEEYDPK
jgi:hypothetical protein